MSKIIVVDSKMVRVMHKDDIDPLTNEPVRDEREEKVFKSVALNAEYICDVMPSGVSESECYVSTVTSGVPYTIMLPFKSFVNTWKEALNG